MRLDFVNSYQSSVCANNLLKVFSCAQCFHQCWKLLTFFCFLPKYVFGTQSLQTLSIWSEKLDFRFNLNKNTRSHTWKGSRTKWWWLRSSFNTCFCSLGVVPADAAIPANNHVTQLVCMYINRNVLFYLILLSFSEKSCIILKGYFSKKYYL